jgi:bifunctional non-homologous end joining protein LigD
MTARASSPWARRRRRARPAAGAGVRITHPERVMDRSSGITKGDLARYHEAVSAWLAPHALRRPLAVVRCPGGAGAECFFQKRAGRGFGRHVARATISGRETFHVTAPEGLLELVQFNAVEIHGWGSRLPLWQRPDQVVFDLDPDAGLAFRRVVEAAFEVRELLEQMGLESYVKTTGGKGLHVVVPLRPRLAWDAIRSFSRTVARELVRRRPGDYVATAGKRERAGRIFVDHLRNHPQATAVLPYSPRARPGATVAMPLAWRDLPHADPREFTVAGTPALLARRRRDPWRGFLEAGQDIGERLGVATLDDGA